MRTWKAMQAGCKHFLEILPRRSGKDRNWISITLEEALKRRGVYFHIYPSLNQGRRDMWDNIVEETIDGVKYAIKMIDMFPPECVASKNETEMQITLINGSIWQVMGADSKEAIDRLRGPNPVGVVYSEYAHMLKEASEVLDPVLAQNGGWDAYVYTPNGENHGKTLYDNVKNDPHWFVQKLTVDDTRCDAQGEDGSPTVPYEAIEALRRKGVREEFIQQEFYTSFTGYMKGTIYGDLMSIADEEKRIRHIPYTVSSPVGTCWDIGVSDATAIWFYQRINQEILFIDYHEDTQKGAQHYARLLREHKPYIYGRMVLPHDARFSGGDFFSTVGFRNINFAPITKKQVGIDKVREMFSRFAFDEEKCAIGISHIRKYSRVWNDILNEFSQEPRHDEHSHGADALRYGCVGSFDPLEFVEGMNTPLKIEHEFDPRIALGGMRG